MVTFVPGFVSQECADWLAGLKAEAARRGLDPKDFGQLFGFRDEWVAATCSAPCAKPSPSQCP